MQMKLVVAETNSYSHSYSRAREYERSGERTLVHVSGCRHEQVHPRTTAASSACRAGSPVRQRALMPRHWLDCVGKTSLASDHSRRAPARQQISAIAPIHGAANKIAISRALTNSGTLTVCARLGASATSACASLG
jgi:hypothetical protein